MKKSDYHKKADDLVNEQLIKNKGAAQEYWIQLSPIQRAKLEVALEESGFASLEEYIKVDIEDFFDEAINRKLCKQYMEEKGIQPGMHVMGLNLKDLPKEVQEFFRRMTGN